MYSIVHVQNRTRWRWRDRLFLNCCRTKFIIFHFNLFCFVLLYNNNRSSCPALEKGHRSWYSMPMKGELTSWVIDVPPHFLHTHLSTGNLPSPHAHTHSVKDQANSPAIFELISVSAPKFWLGIFACKFYRGTQSEGRYRASFSLSYCLESLPLLRCACKCNKGEDDNNNKNHYNNNKSFISIMSLSVAGVEVKPNALRIWFKWRPRVASPQVIWKASEAQPRRRLRQRSVDVICA